MEFLSLTKEELVERLGQLGEPGYRAGQVLDWVFQKRVREFAKMSNLPAALRTKLEKEFQLEAIQQVRKTGSDDTTQKFLFGLHDGQLVESVLIPASPALYGEDSDRRTICISSQVGCAYGCKFCASGLDGWKRNLTAGEIVDQFLQVEAQSGERINNIVFMGMGEPFANFENLMKAISILNSPWGVGLGARHITVSTSGLAPQIRRFADQPLQLRLAISLHAATDEIRDLIMPVNKKHSLADLFEACEYFTTRKKQRLTFEYILIRDVNDSSDQARKLALHAQRLKAKVNLIPYNTVDGLEWTRPEQSAQENFLSILQAADVPATLRREKGHDISAACGQLRLQTLSEKPFAQRATLN